LKQFWKTFAFAAVGYAVLASPVAAQQKPKDEGAAKPVGGEIVEVRIPIGVLDVQAILRNAAAVRNIRDQITKFGTKFESEIEKERGEIRKANQELSRQRTILSPEAFAEKRRKFEQRVVEVQRLVQQRQRELDKSRNEAMLLVNSAYTDIVSKMAAERNLAVILRKGQTVFAVTSLDITQEVLTRLDKHLPMVKVAQPGTDKPAKAESGKPKSGK